MPEYLTPGVYIEEFELGPRSIEGVTTSTAGFLGVTQRGPLEPRLVTSFDQFKRLYGGYLPIGQSNLPFAVDGFFKNGGERCFIGRVTADDATNTGGVHDGKIDIRTIGPGTWGTRVALKIEPGSLHTVGQPLKLFKLTVMYWDDPPPTPIVDPTIPENAAVESAADFYEKRITGNSSLIEARCVGPGVPAVLGFGLLQDLGTTGTDGSAVGFADYRAVPCQRGQTARRARPGYWVSSNWTKSPSCPHPITIRTPTSRQR